MKLIENRTTREVFDQSTGHYYRFINNGKFTTRHQNVIPKLQQLILDKLSVSGRALEAVEGYTIHNLSLCCIGPYIVNGVGKVAYSFNEFGYMEKLLPDEERTKEHLFIKSTTSVPVFTNMYEKGTNNVRATEFLIPMSNGIIRFISSPKSTTVNIEVLAYQEIPSEIMNLLISRIETEFDKDDKEVEVKHHNNPLQGIELLLGFLWEQPNGQQPNSN